MQTAHDRTFQIEQLVEEGPGDSPLFDEIDEFGDAQSDLAHELSGVVGGRNARAEAASSPVSHGAGSAFGSSSTGSRRGRSPD
jgi:hypothetical protein